MSRNQIIQFCQQILTFTKSLSEHPLLRDGAGNVYIEKLPIARIQQLESLLALNKVKTEAYFIRIPQDEVNATVFFDKLGIIARPLK